MTSPRLLIIGLDGAEPTLLERWMAEGRLPHLARIRARGFFSPLRSTVPASTFPAWNTMMTGMNPGRHGMFDFTRMKRGEYAVEFVNATHRQAPTLWSILSGAGRRVGVMGVPSTYPPERLNGFQIAGFDSPVATRITRAFVEPPTLYEEIERRFGVYSIAPFQELDIGPNWHRRALPALLENLERKAGVARWLLERETWDCFMALFGESDTVAHHFWMHHDPASPRHDPRSAREFGDAIRRVYERLDQAVGDLARAAGDDADILVLSDHGFGGAGDRALHLNRWLADQNWLTFRESGAGSLARLARGIGPRFVPQAAQEALFRLWGGRVAGGVESRSRFGAIDWKRTTIYSEELNYFPSMRLNIRGRDPLGILPVDCVNECVEELRAAAAEWRHPVTGEPFIARIHRREELYQGPHVADAPDLILELNLDRGYSYVCVASPASGAGPSARLLAPAEFPGAKNRGMNGSHRPLGILLGAGPGIRKGATPVSPGLEDIAPTALALLRASGGRGMDGRVLAEALQARSGAEAGEGKEADSAPSPVSHAAGPTQPYTPAEEEALRRRLEQMGYLE